MEFWVWSVVCSGIATRLSTLFPSCVCRPKGLLDKENFGKLFFEVFTKQRFLRESRASEGNSSGRNLATRYPCAPDSNNPVTYFVSQITGLKFKAHAS